jgi:long-subunit fatty acid transport protein
MRCILPRSLPARSSEMTHAIPLKRFSAVTVAAVLLGFEALPVEGQTSPDLSRANQDELASFYGRMNVVVGSGARAFGMGGAFLARADDATAASWNPAGISYLRRAEVSLVGVQNDFSQRIPRVDPLSIPSRQVTTLDQLKGSVADFAGLAYPVRLGGRAGAIQISYQRSFSFTGSRRSEAATGGTEFTVEGHGGFDTLSLSSGFEIRPELRLGVSVNRWINGFSQKVDRPFLTTQETELRTRIESNWRISGTNVNLGLIYTPVPKLNLGAVFKTSFDAGVTLTKTRTDKGNVVNEPGPRDNVSIHLPAVLGAGASYRASNTVTISADFTWTQWSKATITNFFALPQNDAKPDEAPPIDEFPMPLPFPAIEEGSNAQSDTSQFRVGAEWVLRFGPSGGVLLPLRAGFFRDGQLVSKRLKTSTDAPKVDVLTPTFSGLTAGIGVTVGGMLIDLAYIREVGDVPTSRYNNGVHDESTDVRYNRLFASVMFRFGPRR